MADQSLTNQISQAIKQVLAFQDKSLVTRPAWGTINFKAAEQDLKRVFSLLANLDLLPLEYLTDQSAQQIKQEIDKIKKPLEGIGTFNIEQQNALTTRDSLVAQVHQVSDSLYTVTAQWVPFLAYQKGDVAENIKKLSSTVSEASRIVDDAKRAIQERQTEIEEIVTKTREASASAGAAVFTSDFNKEAERQEKEARPWLTATAILAVATLVFSYVSWKTKLDPADKGQIWQFISSKIIALSVLLTGTLWCGRLYKALKHQSAVNKHRALSLKTFQAFSAAASDEQTKMAVLLETTRSIFAPAATGLVDSKAAPPEAESKIIEIARTLSPRV